ncbi:MAG TPA: hypothetical protein VLL25_01115 [Acidimicrobiales bacterium]|nr:hypothetical protein [Acidimicrobiales bacterium]
MLVNLVVLMAVAVLPFPSAVLGRYGGQRAAVVLYASAMAIAGSLMTLLGVVARRRHLVSAAVSQAQLRKALVRSGSTAIAFVASIPVAVAAPVVARTCGLLCLGHACCPGSGAEARPDPPSDPVGVPTGARLVPTRLEVRPSRTPRRFRRSCERLFMLARQP